MTNVKSTKRALLTSALALFLCFAMLVGTTFAWFTDSVTSANNIIMSGNLDIELEYWNGQEWADVKDHDDILTNDLWEPGTTEVAYFRVANAGTLALKYQLGINFDDVKAGTNVFGREFLLSDYILFGVDEGITVDNDNAPVEYANREAAILAVPGAQKVSAGFTKAKSMTAGQELYFSLVVYMPTTVENEANYKTAEDGEPADKYRPEINLGINIFATQVAAEEDSFDKYYDGATPWLGDIDTTWYNTTDTEFVIGTAEELAGLAELVNTGVDSFAGKTIKLASNIDLNNINWTPISDGDVDDSVFVGFQGTFDGQDYTIANLYINSTSWGKGLFGYIAKSATVQNVNFYNADVKANDCCGIVVGYALAGDFANISAYGDISVVGTGRDGYVGGLVGCGYNANFDACNVIANDGSQIVSDGPFNGGIVGYQCNNTKTITNCQVRNISITGYSAIGGIAGIVQTGGTAIDNCVVSNVVLNKTRIAGDPSIGALFGCYSGTAQTNVTNSTVNNVTLNGYHVEYSAYNEMYGSNYSGAVASGFMNLDGTTSTGLVNNLKVVIAATPSTVQNLIDNAAAGEIIALGSGDYSTTINLKSNITVIGDRDAVVSCVNLNSADDITLKNITFDAAGAKRGYDYTGAAKQYANIITGDMSNANSTNKSGSLNVVIDGCTFTGTFANGGAAIAFADYKRTSGFSGNITIKNCVFDTENSYYDIYGHYCGNGGNGYGDFIIENNTFKSVRTQGLPVYLGRYASSTPVVVKDNAFETTTALDVSVFVQDHSNYGVSVDASNNTFAQ